MNKPENAILKRLPPDEFAAFVARSSIVRMNLKDSLIEPNQPIEMVDFVESGLHSIVATAASEIVEVATVGREGMIGIPIVLGSNTSLSRCFCQVAGHSYRIPTQDFIDLLNSCPTFSTLCKRYAYSVFEQAAQNSACNRMHSIEERCAKWLLLTHDRMDGPEFELTQEFLAQMLGVRRQGVSLAAGMLQTAGVIRYSRGTIQILNRQSLEEVSCECYELIRKALIPPP